MTEGIIFFFAFQVLFAIASGGLAPRIMYALTVSNGFWNFLQNYALSYQVSYDQIHSTEKFLPEVNSKLEKLLTLALINEAGVGISTDYRRDNGIILRIEKPHTFTGSGYGNTVHFYMDNGMIDEEKYALSPTVFILAQKVYKRVLAAKEQEKIEKKRSKI
ncbi:hypothetical protein FDG95_gp480 [Pectobacterium phage vB_PcaM_CBB]|uniref:Uncharacterized protein n=1 Tax=Pectobacterium phage vB_PcaM_CBB TaxID=2772511 RepID=A0A1L2CVL1_9CAUD|nr:hypothetical protein FDG95_gp480 [Pectobacterium phage vB_PcaM_CBB]AMM44062.1 hypothetical protein CBB_499 [Pectobacterium phage vB_PcaM_CBB]